VNIAVPAHNDTLGKLTLFIFVIIFVYVLAASLTPGQALAMWREDSISGSPVLVR
jgi:hypothetical protein